MQIVRKFYHGYVSIVEDLLLSICPQWTQLGRWSLEGESTCCGPVSTSLSGYTACAHLFLSAIPYKWVQHDILSEDKKNMFKLFKLMMQGKRQHYLNLSKINEHAQTQQQY